MIRKLGPLALLLVLVAVFAVGCGDDEKSDSSNDAPAVTTAADDTATDDTATEEDTSSDDADASENPQVQQAVESCKDSIESNPSVKDDIKDDLKSICDEAASGDEEDVKAAIKKVCEKIVESSVPEGDIRDQAMQACATAGA